MACRSPRPPARSPGKLVELLPKKEQPSPTSAVGKSREDWQGLWRRTR